MNKVEIVHEGSKSHVFINGEELKGVMDYKIRKTSAQTSTEVIIILDTVELIERFKEGKK